MSICFGVFLTDDASDDDHGVSVYVGQGQWRRYYGISVKQMLLNPM